ncbi:MAG: RHS repeat-associated core domain-containing protein [Bacteroidales bacterium]
MQKTQSDVSIDAIASGFRSGFGEMGGISICWENLAACGFWSGIGEIGSISTCWVNVAASGFRVGFGEMANISSRGGKARAFTYDYVKTYLDLPAPHDLLSSGGNKVCFATTPPDMEASCKIMQQSGYTARYTFSAKELDDETQYSYFGARYYDSDLSVWLSVDPLSDKYPNLSSYAYCANNPVMLVDPDGNEIEGFSLDDDNNVVIDKDKASAESLKIYEAMSKTKTGTESFKEMVAKETNITLRLTDEAIYDDQGNQIHGQTKGDENNLIKSGQYKGEYKDATVTISTAEIASNPNDRYNGFSDMEKINGIATHEKVHLDKKQIKKDFSNLSERTREQNTVLLEFRTRMEYQQKYDDHRIRNIIPNYKQYLYKKTFEKL